MHWLCNIQANTHITVVTQEESLGGSECLLGKSCWNAPGSGVRLHTNLQSPDSQFIQCESFYSGAI